MVPSEAFYAALPHIISALDRLPKSDRDPILSTLGWAAALSCFETCPEDLSSSYNSSVAKLGRCAVAALSDNARPECKNYLLAAYAVACGEPAAAMTLIRLDDALNCPKCGHYVNCPHCGSTLSTRFIFSHRQES
jgi:hypothetical protein